MVEIGPVLVAIYALPVFAAGLSVRLGPTLPNVKGNILALLTSILLIFRLILPHGVSMHTPTLVEIVPAVAQKLALPV